MGGISAAGNPRAGSRRAPRSSGPRTTLRVPEGLAAVAGELADEVGISHNDALIRLATEGARIFQREQRIEQRRAARWAAVTPGGLSAVEEELPLPDEARAAVLSARDEPASG